MDIINTDRQELIYLLKVFKNYIVTLNKSRISFNQVTNKFEMEEKYRKYRYNSEDDDPEKEIYSLIMQYESLKKEILDLYKMLLNEECTADFETMVKTLEEYHNQ
ncbi:MAG: hypothetical protein K6D97_02385 [Clostridia bacterium]|nr:hypothetical protein [Clostridia bacterium]